MGRAADGSKRSGGRNVQQPLRFKPNSATADKTLKKAETRSKKQKVLLGDDVLDEASFNSQELRPPPGSSKRLRHTESDEEGSGRRSSKNARRTIAYNEDDNNSQADDMSALSSEDQYVKDSDDDNDEDDHDDDEEEEEEEEESAEDLAEQAGARKLLKSKISERERSSSQVLSLFSLLCIF
jgi:hypothetical protein